MLAVKPHTQIEYFHLFNQAALTACQLTCIGGECFLLKLSDSDNLSAQDSNGLSMTVETVNIIFSISVSSLKE